MQLAIYSPADRLQPHRYKADESYEVGGPDMTPVQCYLDVEGILALAKCAPSYLHRAFLARLVN